MKGFQKATTKFNNSHLNFGSWDGIVSIATCYRLDGPGLKPWWGQETFSSPYSFIPALIPTQPPLQ